MITCQRKSLLEKIEETRNQMMRLALKNGFTCDKTLQVSKQLDELLNRYQEKDLIM